jgi:hypothetical protein
MGGGSGTGSEGTRQAWSLQFVGLDHELVGFGRRTRHDRGNQLSRPPPRFRRQLVRSADGGEAKQAGRDETAAFRWMRTRAPTCSLRFELVSPYRRRRIGPLDRVYYKAGPNVQLQLTAARSVSRPSSGTQHLVRGRRLYPGPLVVGAVEYR